MKNLIYFCLLLTSSVLFVSCEREPSDSVDQNKIYAKYEIVYDKNEDKTKVRAEFHFGGLFGTKLELTSGANVKFNGSLIPYNSTLAYYESEFTGLISSGTFVYTDVEGNVYTNTTDELKSVAFSEDPITITHGTDYVLSFVGNPIGSDDVVTVNISDKVFATSISGATSLTLGGVQTSSITPGPYIGYMYRTLTRVPASATTEGGLILLTYKAANKAITVE